MAGHPAPADSKRLPVDKNAGAVFEHLRSAQMARRVSDKDVANKNGRIERLFGTLKAKSRDLLFDQEALPEQLALFRFWYNHIRTHQYLDGRTPCEVLNRLPAQNAMDDAEEPAWFEAWNGRLAGYWFPPG